MRGGYPPLDQPSISWSRESYYYYYYYYYYCYYCFNLVFPKKFRVEPFETAVRFKYEGIC